MPGVLSLHCSVCKEGFNGKPDWNRHLLQDKHQLLARKELLNWGEEERACALVVYGRLPVGKDDQIIKALSQGLRTFVTDFVWWEERPRVGFVQFESSKKAAEVAASLENRQFRIQPNQLCHVREGRSISELDWNEQLPEHVAALMAGLPEPDPEVNSPHLLIVSSSDPHPGHTTNCKTDANISTGIITTTGIRSPFLSPGRPPSEDLGLRHHLSSILKLIKIPDQESKLAKDIQRSIQKILDSNRWKFQMFRVAPCFHWRVGLQCPPKHSGFGHTPLYFLLHSDDDCAHLRVSDFDQINQELFEQRGKQTFFLSYEASHLHTGTFRDAFRFFNIKKCPTLEFPIELGIVSGPIFHSEDRLWRLLQYLAGFDPHCFPVMAGAYYWSAVNSLFLGGRQRNHPNRTYPLALNCLLLVFFQKEWLIPIPGSILERHHKKELYRGKDIGFTEDAQLAISWRTNMNTWDMDTSTEEFAEGVFRLLSKFFLFCSAFLPPKNTEKGQDQGCGWILNTRDAEIYRKIDLISGIWLPDDSKLTKGERAAVVKALEGCSDWIVILHPLVVDWWSMWLSTRDVDKTFRAMKMSGMKLKEYLGDGTKLKGGRKLESKEFLNLLRIE